MEKARNNFVHDLVNLKYKNDDVKQIALFGQCIVKVLNNKSTLINKHNDKSFEEAKKIIK